MITIFTPRCVALLLSYSLHMRGNRVFESFQLRHLSDKFVRPLKTLEGHFRTKPFLHLSWNSIASMWFFVDLFFAFWISTSYLRFFSSLCCFRIVMSVLECAVLSCRAMLNNDIFTCSDSWWNITVLFLFTKNIKISLRIQCGKKVSLHHFIMRWCYN